MRGSSRQRLLLDDRPAIYLQSYTWFVPLVVGFLVFFSWDDRAALSTITFFMGLLGLWPAFHFAKEADDKASLALLLPLFALIVWAVTAIWQERTAQRYFQLRADREVYFETLAFLKTKDQEDRKIVQ
jgi:hypothetical protein